MPSVGCAGLLSWQAIIYADVVKSRLQADSFTRPRYSGTWDCVVQSYTRDGARVFCRGECRVIFSGENIITLSPGFTLMSLRAFPLNGATFLGYEYSMKLFRHLNGSHTDL